MRQIFARLKYFTATILFVLTTSLSTGGAVFADSNNGNNPPGNNGTVKIDSLDADDNDAPNANDPHVNCSFAVNFYNYDEATINATVGFALQSPTNGAGHSMTVTGNQSPTFVSPGGALVLDHSEPYTLSFTGAPQVNQGYHVKMTVHAPYSHGSDTKYKTFWVGPCTKEVIPTTPVPSVPNCDVKSMTVTPPAITGIIWTPAGSTTLQPGQSVTYTASADTANGYVLAQGAITSFPFTNTFNDTYCPKPPTPVTPTAPYKTTPNCEVKSMTVTPPSITGVIWTPAGATTLQPGQSVTYVASADTANGYVLAQGATTSFPFTNNFNPASCPCGCEHTVTPGEVTFHEVCGYVNDTYTIPSTPHVNYYVNGSIFPSSPGIHHLTPGQTTINVVAKATGGYTISGTHSWSHHFTNEPCVIKVYPPKAEFKDLCAVKDDTFTIPSKTGVYYKVNGHVVAAGTYDAWDYDVNGTVTVTAYASHGYMLNGEHSWSHHFTNEACGGSGGQIPATPAVATFADVCETVNDTYTVPATTGVTYKVNGVVTAAGSYNGTGTVTITAEPMTGYVLNGPASWAHTFTNEACGQPQVLGDSTVVFTPAPAGHGAEAPAEELANTGQNSMASAIAAFLVLTSAIFVYAFVPKRQIS